MAVIAPVSHDAAPSVTHAARMGPFPVGPRMSQPSHRMRSVIARVANTPRSRGASCGRPRRPHHTSARPPTWHDRRVPARCPMRHGWSGRSRCGSARRGPGLLAPCIPCGPSSPRRTRSALTSPARRRCSAGSVRCPRCRAGRPGHSGTRPRRRPRCTPRRRSPGMRERRRSAAMATCRRTRGRRPGFLRLLRHRAGQGGWSGAGGTRPADATQITTVASSGGPQVAVIKTPTGDIGCDLSSSYAGCGVKSFFDTKPYGESAGGDTNWWIPPRQRRARRHRQGRRPDARAGRGDSAGRALRLVRVLGRRDEPSHAAPPHRIGGLGPPTGRRAPPAQCRRPSRRSADDPQRRVALGDVR